MRIGARKIFLDLKFHDIPRTVLGACRSASHLPVSFLSVHCEGLWEGQGKTERPAQAGGPEWLGITVLTGFDPAHLDQVGPIDRVVIGNAVPKTNVEVEEVLRRGLHVPWF